METRHIIQKGGQGSDRLPAKEAAFTHAHAGFAPMDVVPCGNNGSKQEHLYGFNLLYDDKSIEYDSLINPPRNRDAGYPRAGRTVADPAARTKIEEIVRKWILE